MRIEIQTVSSRAHASACVLTELSRLASLGPLNPDQPNLARLMANQGGVILEAARELEFECARLVQLADAHTELLRTIYGHTVALVDCVRLLAPGKDAAFDVSDALDLVADIQQSIAEKFPGDACFYSDDNDA